MIAALLLAAPLLSGCAVALGAGAVVVADEVMEDRQGDDGLI